MSQTYVPVARVNLRAPEEAPKYYAVARSGRTVNIKEVAKRIAERSSYSRGELEGCIGEFLIEILNVLEQGNIVQLADLGYFRMTIRTATPTLTAEEFKKNCIAGGRILFRPGKEFQKLCKIMEYTPLGKSKDGNGGETATDDGTTESHGNSEQGSENTGSTGKKPENSSTVKDEAPNPIL